jgi:nitroreductase
MELFEVVRERRSIRSYRGDPVDDELIERILRAAMAAPSAGNEQPWEFLIIREKETLRRISSAHPYAEMVQHAPVAILVCGNLNRVRHQDYWVQDLAAATENMLLAIHALGLGSVWVGIYPREPRVAEIRSVLSLPERIVPFALLPIGHPGEHKSPEDRYDEARIHQEQWGQ